MRYLSEMLLHLNLGMSFIMAIYTLYTLHRYYRTAPREEPATGKMLAAITKATLFGMLVLAASFIYRYYMIEVPFGNPDVLKFVIVSLINYNIMLALMSLPASMLSKVVDEREGKRINAFDKRKHERKKGN